MVDKNINIPEALNDDELENVAGGSGCGEPLGIDSRMLCPNCGEEMIAASVADYPSGSLPACVCRKCGYERW